MHSPPTQPHALPSSGATLAPLIGLDARLRHAGAVMVDRWGCAVAGHYGSVAGELAVCVKSVGIANRSDLERIELRGREAWLDHALAKVLGDCVPPTGQATRVAGTWCCRTSPERALVIGSHPSVSRWRRFAREAVVSGSAIRCADLATEVAAVSLVGPRSPDVLRNAGLPHGLAVGAVCPGVLGDTAATVLREDAHRFLLLLDAGPSDSAWEALFEAGRPLGLSYVGCEALERLAAVPRSFPLAG